MAGNTVNCRLTGTVIGDITKGFGVWGLAILANNVCVTLIRCSGTICRISSRSIRLMSLMVSRNIHTLSTSERLHIFTMRSMPALCNCAVYPQRCRHRSAQLTLFKPSKCAASYELIRSRGIYCPTGTSCSDTADCSAGAACLSSSCCSRALFSARAVCKATNSCLLIA